MSPPNALDGASSPLAFKAGSVSAGSSMGDATPVGGGVRTLGFRESHQALAELKMKLEFALSRLNDQDTQRTGIEEIREFLHGLYPDWFPVVINCIVEAGQNLKPLGRCESVKLLGLLAELHGEIVIPLLPRILQVIITRLQDADLHLREACAETVFRLAGALVTPNGETSQVFASLLKPLFAALGEHSKWVQIGAASCICSVIQGSPPNIVQDNLGRLCARLVQHLTLPLAQARPQLLSACIYALQAVGGAGFDEMLPSLMPCLENCLGVATDWQTRKQAIEVLQTIGDDPELGRSLELPPPQNPNAKPTPLQRRVAMLLEDLRTDKVRAVREAAKDVISKWNIAKGAAAASVYSSSALGRSNSPGPVSASAPALSMRSSSNCTIGSDFGAQSQLYTPEPRGQVPRSGSPALSHNNSQQGVQLREPGGVTRRVSRPTVRTPTNDSAIDESRSTISPEHDGVAERAATRRTAVREALSGAVLNTTKTPRPKKDRQSIFSGPANAQFFKSLPGQAPSVARGIASDDTLEGELSESGEQSASEEAPRRATSSRDLSVRSGQCSRGQSARSVASAPAAMHFRKSLGSSDEEGDDPATLLPEHIEVGPPSYAPSTPDRNHGSSEIPNPRGTPKDRSVYSSVAASEIATDFAEIESDLGEFSSTKQSQSECDSVLGPSRRVASRSPNDSVATVASNASQPYTKEQPRTLRQVMAPLERKNVPQSGPFDSRQDDERLQARMDNLQKQMETILAESMRALEDSRLESEDRIADRLVALERACESYRVQASTLQNKLMASEQTIEAQALLIKSQEQRIRTQEQQLALQEANARQQDMQINHQDDQLHQHEARLKLCEESLGRHEQAFQLQKTLSESSVNIVKVVAAKNAEASERRTIGMVAPTVVLGTCDNGSVGSSERSDVKGVASDGWSEVSTRGAPSNTTSWHSPMTAQTTNLSSNSFVGVGGSGQSPRLERLSSERLTIDRQVPDRPAHGSLPGPQRRSGALWDRVLEMCEAQRFLEAYKQVIAEPEESCLLRLMGHTGPIVEKLDAESNSRLIRRLIHILSSPSKDPSTASIELIFSWLDQALDVGIHFTTSQIEDLAIALKRCASPTSMLSAEECTEASSLLSRVAALKRP